jgi:NAD(P)-dependent dehydrogenase (short-subunit alcohol dehydrogenase family)
MAHRLRDPRRVSRQIPAGKVVVITGAASALGKGLALALAHRGATVVLPARRERLVHELAQACEAAGGRALPVATNVSEQADVEQLAHRVIAEFRGIDAWINSAGIGPLGAFERIRRAKEERVIEINLLGTLYGSHTAYGVFLLQRYGTLINIALALGRETPYSASYTASRHAVVGLCEALRQDLTQNGLDDIHVCLVMPTAGARASGDHAARYTRREPASAPLHDPQNMIDTLVALAVDPEGGKLVGADGVVKVPLVEHAAVVRKAS